MPITYGDAKARISQWAEKGGICSNDPKVDIFLREVLDYMLISGQYGNERKFVFNACKGIFTVPYEVEVPLKVKIDDQVGSVWDKWFEWYGYGDFEKCLHTDALLEEPNLYPIVYDLPDGGANVGTLGICDEAPDAYIIVKGVDNSGRQVITYHKGEQITGEYLSICNNQIKCSTVRFGRIDEIVKSKTKGYVQLLWIKPETSERGFLSDYSPSEEHPQYRRFKIKTKCHEYVKVSILARIRLKEHYADNDLIPFDNLYTLSLAAQSVNAQYNNDPQTAQAKDTFMQDIIARENVMKKPQSGMPIEVFFPLSGGSIKNICQNRPFAGGTGIRWRFR